MSGYFARLLTRTQTEAGAVRPRPGMRLQRESDSVVLDAGLAAPHLAISGADEPAVAARSYRRATPRRPAMEAPFVQTGQDQQTEDQHAGSRPGTRLPLRSSEHDAPPVAPPDAVTLAQVAGQADPAAREPAEPAQRVLVAAALGQSDTIEPAVMPLSERRPLRAPSGARHADRADNDHFRLMDSADDAEVLAPSIHFDAFAETTAGFRAADGSGRRGSARAGASLAAASSAETNTVHVTIGRIEVRAVQEAAPQQKPRPDPRQSMSLDEYLLRRKGARR